VAETSLGIAVHVYKEVMGSEVFSKVLRDMLSLYSNKVLKLLAKEVGQDVLQGKNVRESVKTHGGDVVKEQGARSKDSSASNWAWTQEKAKSTQ
jgi:UTP-glucose-1-phosphate uridylyltransferase